MRNFGTFYPPLCVPDSLLRTQQKCNNDARVCLHTYIYIHTYVRTYIHTYIYIYIYIYMHTSTCLDVELAWLCLAYRAHALFM